jgi:hypothetical protein
MDLDFLAFEGQDTFDQLVTKNFHPLPLIFG